MKCHKCGSKQLVCGDCGARVADIFEEAGAKGGSATGKSKARSPEQARKAAMARWSKKPAVPTPV